MLEGIILITVMFLAFTIIVALYDRLTSRRKCRERESRRLRKRIEHFQGKG